MNPLGQPVSLTVLADPIVDVCFNGASFWIVQALIVSLSGVISTLFGWLMLSYRFQLKAAEAREQRLQEDCGDVVSQRNEALARLNQTRERYHELTETVVARHPRSRRRPPGETP